MTALLFPKRGEIWLVNFDPTLGAEIKKTRPAVILQNDISNQWSPVTIVAALTTRVQTKKYPTNVLLYPPEGGLTDPSSIMLNQLRTVDKQRLIKKLGVLTDDSMRHVNQALLISLGLVVL